MDFASISKYLEVFDLKQMQIDLSTIQNRRFMYHSDGILILGAEDATKRSRGIQKSHAEEYGEAERLAGKALPPYDEFVRGWIGVGKDYPNGIIHFAPHIPSSCGLYFDTAFEFIEVALENGFVQNSVLRGFGEVWERPVSDVVGKRVSAEKKKPLEMQIKNAEARVANSEPNKEKANFFKNK
jgi:hypothetical protein